MLAGAVNTAIVGSNGVLNRVSEDGILSEWFRHPHRRFGTSYRILNLVVGLQMLTILLSRGNILILGEAYAFGVMWSFAMKGLAVLVLRFKSRASGNFVCLSTSRLGNTELPVGVALITLTLFALMHHQPVHEGDRHHLRRGLHSGLFRRLPDLRNRHPEAHQDSQPSSTSSISPSKPTSPRKALAFEPGNILVPVSTYYTLYHLEAALRRAHTREAEIVVLHVRLLRRSASGEYDLAPDQLFSTIEQLLFTKVLGMAEKEGKPVRLAVAAANDLWEGILRAAMNLQSSTIVVGSSAKMVRHRAGPPGRPAWERMGEPRPHVTLEIFTPSGQEQVFYLGPHAPRLTPNEVDLLHKIWLQLSERLPGQEIHHHDIVHFALTEVEREISAGDDSGVLERLRNHLKEIQGRRFNP